MPRDLEVDGLRKHFGKVPAAEDLSFRLDGGSYNVVLGPSGSGKTSLLHMTAGLLPPDGGSIRLGDRLLEGPGVHVPAQDRKVALVFQDYALWPHLPVFEQVAFSLRLRRAPRSKITQSVQRWLTLLRLEDLGQRFPHQLSGGQKQRVAIARALAAEPELLLLDEPFSNLDAPLRGALREELLGLQKELGLTVLHVTHDRQDALEMADRVLVMHQGRLVQEGTTYELYLDPRNPYVAALFGTANLIHGAVEQDGTTTTVANPDLRLVGTPTVPVDGHGVAFFRPEDVRLLADMPQPVPANCFPAKITKSAFHDGRWRHRLHTGHQEVWAVGHQPFTPGSLMWIHVPPDACRILNP